MTVLGEISRFGGRVWMSMLIGAIGSLVMGSGLARADSAVSDEATTVVDMPGVWRAHERFIDEARKTWDHPGRFGRKSRNEASRDGPETLFRWYEAMGSAARDEVKKLNDLLSATETLRARYREQGDNDIACFLTIVADFDRWLVLHFEGLAEDVKLVVRHKRIALRGCDFIAADISGKDVDWKQLVDFYRKTLSPRLDGRRDTSVPTVTSSKYRNLLCSFEAFVDKVAGHLSHRDAKRFVDGICEALACRYDCAYINYAMREWSQASGDVELARVIGKFGAWSDGHGYGGERYLDGMLDAIRPQYVGVFWYRGGPLDRCDPRIVAWSEKLKGKTAYDRAVEAHTMFRDLDKKKVLVGGGGGATIKQCLDIGKAGCGMGSGILGSTLASSGMDGVCGVGLRGEGSAHGIVSVQTEKGLLFLDRATPLCALYDEYIRIRRDEARRYKQYRSFMVLERSFGSQARSFLLFLGADVAKPVVYDQRPVYYRCQRDGTVRQTPMPTTE